jgi:adenosylmethionine-8-amino-7-oxononanoate aminotransferase
MKHPLACLDQRYVWHPFTQMRDWARGEPIVIVEGHGPWLVDARGREYLDANASIWTNLHGHRHPKINGAIARQLRRIAHSSALGLANEPASRLAERLVLAVNRGVAGRPAPTRLSAGIRTAWSGAQPRLAKVFFSDDGSTALEVALKLAYEFARRVRNQKSPRFLSLQGAYHGDTVGAVSLGHIDLFHKAYAGLLFKSDQVMAPYCYRCPFNRGVPERVDARVWRQCNQECLAKVERAFDLAARRGRPYCALVVEPLMQGAAGMIPQPTGWLGAVAKLARNHGAQLIADEVMTGFGRTGPLEEKGRLWKGAGLFACHQEGVQPDYLCLAKGLTGGYLPMSATLTTREVFEAFLGEYEEFKSFFHGHSYTGNQLGSAAGLANLDLLETKRGLRARVRLQKSLAGQLKTLWALPQVGDIRQVGLMAGVELVRDWRTKVSFDLRERIGIRVCERMARRGVLTRPIGNVIVLMPPYCATPSQVGHMISALAESVREVLGASRPGLRKSGE